MRDALSLMLAGGVTSLLVVDSAGTPVGALFNCRRRVEFSRSADPVAPDRDYFFVSSFLASAGLVSNALTLNAATPGSAMRLLSTMGAPK